MDTVDRRGMNRHALYEKALNGRAEVYHFIGRLKPSIGDYASILARARDPSLRQAALAGLSSLSSDLSDYRQELSYANRLLRVARGQDACSKGRAWLSKAVALRDLGRYASALRTAGRAVRLFHAARKTRRMHREDRRRIQEQISNAYQTMGQVNNLQGRYHSALAFYNKSLKIVKAIGDQTAISQRLNNIGLVHWRQGRFYKARQFYRRSLAIGEKIGYRHIVSSALNNLGNICYETERFQAALGFHRRAWDMNRAIGSKLGAANNLNNMGLCYGSMYDLGNALKHFTLSMNIFSKINHAYGSALTTNNVGMTHCEMGDYAKAAACEAKAERIARRAGMADVVLRCLMLRARVYRARRRFALSARILKKAISSAKHSKLEGLRIDAAMQYLKTAVEAGPMAGTSGYVRQVERAYRKATINYDRCFALITLIQCALAREDHRDAKRKFRALSALMKQCIDRKMISQFLLLGARLDMAAGKDPRPALKKAKAAAQAAGLKPLVDEAVALDRAARPR